MHKELPYAREACNVLPIGFCWSCRLRFSFAAAWKEILRDVQMTHKVRITKDKNCSWSLKDSGFSSLGSGCTFCSAHGQQVPS